MGVSSLRFDLRRRRLVRSVAVAPWRVGSSVAGGAKQYGVMVAPTVFRAREDRPRNLTLLTHTPKSMMYGSRWSFRSLRGEMMS